MSILKLIEWVEGAPNRARRLVLISTVIVYLMVTVGCLLFVGFGISMEQFINFYYALSTVASSAIGFYAGEKISINRKEAKQEKDNN